MAGKGRVLAISVIFPSLAALAASLPELYLTFVTFNDAICCFCGHWHVQMNLTPGSWGSAPQVFTWRKVTPAKRGPPPRLTGQPALVG